MEKSAETIDKMIEIANALTLQAIQKTYIRRSKSYTYCRVWR